MKKSITQQIKEHIPRKSTVILAFSGGPDSVYLFKKLENIKKVHHFNVILAHFNHKLRGKDSDDDENFCILFAKKHNAVLETDSKNIASLKGNTEDLARKYRYQFLENVRKKYDAKFILTAHHLDDNIETFLLNFLRGTGLKGLSGMQVKSGNILRPLLETTKNEITKYLKENNIKFRIDKSNFDESYTRNNIRKNIIPALKNIQPSLQTVFLRNWKTLSEMQEYLDSKAHDWIMANVKTWYKIPLHSFNSTEKFIQSLILKDLYNLYHRSIDNLSQNTIQRAQNIVNLKKTGKKVPFGPQTELIVNSNSFEILPKNKIKKITRKKIEFNKKNKYALGEIELKILKKTPKNLKKGIYLDYTKCNFPLYVRGKTSGDTFRNIGMKGTQKLQDFFVNKKIPVQKRESIPLITDKNNKVIAVGNMAIADTHKITKQTKEILSISFKPSLENNQK